VPSLFRMLDLHEAVERERQRPGGRLFVSDYNGGHPYVADYLGPLADTPPYLLGDVTRYSAIDEDRALRTKIATLHGTYDGVEYGPDQVIPAGGSSSVLGTFQYLRWDGGLGEESAAALAPELTLRLVCPTKYLSVHGYRCAHLLVPERLREPLADLHINLHGDVTVADRLFAHRAADLMLDGEGNRRLVEHVRANHQRLVGSGALPAAEPVETGYFLFARPAAPADRLLALDQRYFELTGHDGFVRINLLNEPALQGLQEMAPSISGG
jgi:aspartate/methionine/tyrosine aminotransferase